MQRTFVFLTKILLLFVLIWMVFFGVVIVTTEFHVESGISEYGLFLWHKNAYEKIRGFVLNDTEDKAIKQKIQASFSLLEEEKNAFFSQIENFKQDKNLYDAIFFYVVSGSLPSLRSIIDTYWQDDPFFVECYVVGESGDLLYKYGGYTLSPQKVPSQQIYTFQRDDTLIDCILNWRDETFEKELQFHFLFREDKFFSWIQKSSFPLILQLGETFFKTAKVPRVNSLDELSQNTHYGSYALYRFPLIWKNVEIGTAFYFVKRYGIGWFFVFLVRLILVVGVFGGMVGFFFWVDHMMNKMLSYQKKREQPENELDEQNIQWIEEFLANQREEKK
ncbi:hypothetical protein BREVNS_2282 [Brevinematales bacterium NS]|nr:hypothetical protein [Brevinematales bacterium]QJR23032.1 hypothetical protein BREVNS_2282 [Brevinematales bacterium NS]